LKEYLYVLYLEANSAADNSFDNQFQKLNIIDATEEPKPAASGKFRINPVMLQQAMRSKYNDDD
jgi:hypothetical protein